MYSVRSLHGMTAAAERNPITGAGLGGESDRPRQGRRTDAPVPPLDLAIVLNSRESTAVVVKPSQSNSTYSAIKNREREEERRRAEAEAAAYAHARDSAPRSAARAPLTDHRGSQRDVSSLHGTAGGVENGHRATAHGTPARHERNATSAKERDLLHSAPQTRGKDSGAPKGKESPHGASQSHTPSKKGPAATHGLGTRTPSHAGGSTHNSASAKKGTHAHGPTSSSSHAYSQPADTGDVGSSRSAYVSGGKTVYSSHPLYADPERERISELQMLEESLALARDGALASIAADSTESQLVKKLRLMEDAIAGDELANSLVDSPFVDPGPPPVRNDAATHAGLAKRGVAYDSQFSSLGGLNNARHPPTADQIFGQKVAFLARVVTKNGRDIHRELGGFFFVADGSLVVYEFRQFGQKTNVLPLYRRRVYRYPIGERAGKPIALSDIRVGNDLIFEAALGRLPETMRDKPLVGFRVTEVDEALRERLLGEFKARLSRSRDPVLADIAGEVDLVGERSKKPKAPTAEEKILESARAQVRERIIARGGRGIVGIGRHFRSIDRNGDGLLDRSEFYRGLREYGFKFDEKTQDVLFRAFDRDHSGTIDYDEFIRGVVGEMSETRKGLVRKAFQRLDANKNGIIELDDIRKFYNAKRHPKVISGECTEDEILLRFLDVFDCVQRDGRVTYEEFEEYYEGVSMSIPDDRYFAVMMRNSWGVH